MAIRIFTGPELAPEQERPDLAGHDGPYWKRYEQQGVPVAYRAFDGDGRLVGEGRYDCDEAGRIVRIVHLDPDGNVLRVEAAPGRGALR